jgi:ubiquinone/menaquinone biosynthesis C-methylase UbiE
MSTIERDFDRLALLDESNWTGNNHYHQFLLQHVPVACIDALEVGCGTGMFSRRLAEKANHVTAIDLSSEMIRIARARSARAQNLDYLWADVMSCELAGKTFDCIVTIATLHHLPQRAAIAKLKQILRPNGVLLVLDLFEPERSLFKFRGWVDATSNLLAMGVSGSLRLVNNGRLKPPAAVRAAWAEHGKTDRYATMQEVRALCAEILPRAQIRQHLLWRYSIVWRNKVE